MAVPSDMTVSTLNGTFVLNKEKSDPIDPMFKIQGLGWVTRKAVGIASVSLIFTSYTEMGSFEQPVLHVNLDQIATGGIKNAENRICDWEDREFSDVIFGKQIGRFRVIDGVKDDDGAIKPDLQLQTHISSDSAQDEKVKRFLRGEIDYDGKPSQGWIVVDPNSGDLHERNGQWLHSWVRSKSNGWTLEQLWGFESVDGNRVWSRRVVAAKGRDYSLVRMVHAYQHA